MRERESEMSIVVSITYTGQDAGHVQDAIAMQRQLTLVGGWSGIEAARVGTGRD